MSLDLIKDALYQRLKANLPDLVFLPEYQPDVDPVALSGMDNPPLLSFSGIETERLADPPQDEYITATVSGTLYRLPVLARFQTVWHLQLRQQPGPNRSLTDIRATSADLLRDLTRLRALDLGPTSSLAVFWVQDIRQEVDEVGLAHIDDIRQLVEWQLIETHSFGTALHTADEIDVYFNGQLLVTVS